MANDILQNLRAAPGLSTPTDPEPKGKIEAHPDIAPWDIQPGEDLEAFAAFVTYRDMPGRSRKSTARSLNVDEGKVKAWAERWAWSDRVRDWEAQIDEVRRNEFLSVQKEGAHRDAVDMVRIASDLVKLGAKGLSQHHEFMDYTLTQASKSDTPSRPYYKAKEVQDLVEAGIKLSQLLAGQPTDRTEVTDVDNRREMLRKAMGDKDVMRALRVVSKAVGES